MAYRNPKEVVEELCAEWRLLTLGDDDMGVAMDAIDQLAQQEGFVDKDGNANTSQIDLAVEEYSHWARQWFHANPQRG